MFYVLCVRFCELFCGLFCVGTGVGFVAMLGYCCGVSLWRSGVTCLSIEGGDGLSVETGDCLSVETSYDVSQYRDELWVTCLSIETGDGLSVETGDVPQYRSG